MHFFAWQIKSFFRLLLQSLDLLFRSYSQILQTLYPSHYIAGTIIKLLFRFIIGTGESGYQIADSCKGIFESRNLII